MKYRPSWEMETIPDDVFNREHARRNGLKGGRPRTLRPCPDCAIPMGTEQLRYHASRCRKAQPRLYSRIHEMLRKAAHDPAKPARSQKAV